MKQVFEKGDHLIVQCGVYSHHGIYLGGNQVIHYSGSSSGKGLLNAGVVEISSLADFSEGKPIKLKIHDDAPYKGEEVVERALSRLGEEKYSALFHNCEHFANWCHDGVAQSEQVKRLSHATTFASSAFMAAKPISKAFRAVTGKSLQWSSLNSPWGIALGAGLLTWGVYRMIKK